MNDDSTIQPERDALLLALEKKAAERFIPIIKPQVGQFLQILIKIKKPGRILEVGTAIGYSTIWMARAAGPAVEIVSIEINEERAAEARENFRSGWVEEQINLKIGDAREIIPFLRRKFELVLLDGAKGQYLDYLEPVLEILSPGGVIVADNVLYHGEVLDQQRVKHKRRTMVNHLREYLRVVANHPLLESSIIPIGDGIALSVRR